MKILKLIICCGLIACMSSCELFLENEHAYVDLGLSVKWATCNIGAESPEDYGDYFAWGEVVKGDGKISSYKWLTNTEITIYSKYWNESSGEKDHKYTLESVDDVARAKWGVGWRMPSDNEINELLTKCTWYLTNVNGVKGYKVVGPNGNSIFLPAAGAIYNGNEYFIGYGGFYWSSSLYRQENTRACFLGFDLEQQSIAYAERYVAQSVRPVRR